MAATHGPVADGARARPSDPDSADSSKWLFFSSLYANAIEYLREGPRPDACHDLVLHLCTVSGELLKRVPPGASSMPDKGDVALFEPMAYITLAALILREFRKFSDPEYEARRNELAAVWQATLRAARAMDASDFSADPGAPPPF